MKRSRFGMKFSSWKFWPKKCKTLLMGKTTVQFWLRSKKLKIRLMSTELQWLKNWMRRTATSCEVSASKRIWTRKAKKLNWSKDWQKKVSSKNTEVLKWESPTKQQWVHQLFSQSPCSLLQVRFSKLQFFTFSIGSSSLRSNSSKSAKASGSTVKTRMQESIASTGFTSPRPWKKPSKSRLEEALKTPTKNDLAEKEAERERKIRERKAIKVQFYIYEPNLHTLSELGKRSSETKSWKGCSCWRDTQ